MKKPHSSFWKVVSRGLILFVAGASLSGRAGSIIQQHNAAIQPSGGSSSSSNSNNSSTSQTTTPATTATTQAAQTAAMVQRAQISLQHSAQVLQAQRTAQGAARAAANAATSTVPNGLVTGGLVPLDGLTAPVNTTTTSTGSTTTYTLPGSWIGVGGLSETKSTTTPAVVDTVTQIKQQSLLYWSSFNIGKNTTLKFDQSAGGANVGDWVAINKISNTLAPSQILGSIQAPGQVYVINQNGIIFGGSSQVNVGALVASSLPINDNLIARGLLNNPDNQFLFSQLTINALSNGSMPAFTPPAAPAGGDGNIVVEAGAQLSSNTTADHVGGKIALIGPNVSNAGTISTPDGQTILAAGNQVGLAAHDAHDPSLRGLDVYVGAVDATSGTVENTGIIDSPRADITMAGKTVNQSGVINSSTSVAYNGRIDLLADYNSTVTISPITQSSIIKPTKTGDVNLGTGSLTQIVPELSSTDTVVGSKLALSSLVNIQGLNIHLASDSLLYAPSAALPSDTSKPALTLGGSALTSGVTLNAGNWLLLGSLYTFNNTSGQVNLDAGATIDVSGSQNVAASVAENIVTAQLLGTELANSPLQQNGSLRGQTIQFDLRQTGVNDDGTTWIGTPLADVSGYVNLVQHTVGELTTAGGTVAIKAGSAVNLQPTANINVSGGWINYQGGTVQTTQVLVNGQIHDISQATPDMIYDGTYNGSTQTSTKWGTSVTFINSLLTGSHYEQGYIQGGNGGGLSITAPSMTLSGNFYGNTVAGAQQRTLGSQLSTTYAGTNFLPTVLATKGTPTLSSLSLNFQGQNAAVSGYSTYSPTPPRIDFDVSQGAGDLVLSSDLVNSNGFGRLTINNGDGSIYVPQNVSLNTAAGGSITFNAANLDIEGSLSAASGSLNFTVTDYSPYAVAASPITGQPLLATPTVDTTRGLFTLGANASLSTAGLVVDDRPASATANSLPLATNGGTIAINSYGINFADGSQINVSGGAAVSAAGKVSYGAGGTLSILAGKDPNIPSLVGGSFRLGSSLRGYSGAQGGSLTIQAPLVQVGGSAADPEHTLLLTPEFFTQGLKSGSLSEGGFASLNFAGLGEVAPGQSNPNDYLPGVNIAAGIVIAPVVQSWQADLSGNNVALNAITQPLASLRSPANISFNAQGVIGFGGGVVVRGDLLMGAGSVIRTDPKGSVSLAGQTVDVLGSIYTPGGTISISGAKDSTSFFAGAPDAPLVTVDIGANSVLSTAGTTLLSYNAYGYRTGSVLAGGKINVSGNILAEQGSVLDVSGASGVLDVLPSQIGSTSGKRLVTAPYVSTRVDSSGGAITLTGGQELFSNATLRGAAGGASAQGGSLTVKSGFFVSQADINTPTSPTQVTLQVTQGLQVNSSSGIGNSVFLNGAALGLGYFAADSFNTSGLGSLTLNGTVQFLGSVQINANRSITVGSSGVIYADGDVNLTAPYVKLGQAFQGPLSLAQQVLPIFTDSAGNPVSVAPSNGTGSLTVTADSLVDVGNLSLQNVGTLNLTASHGDIRGDGTLDVAGDIVLTAGQIYPTTDTAFTIAAFDHNGTQGSVIIEPTGQTRQLPYSAGGTLNIYASTIMQWGVLRAPMGTINLGSGVTSASPIDPLSGQAVNSTQLLTLATGSVTSVSAIDPVTGQDLTLPYGTILNGVSWIDPAGNDITAAGNGANAIPNKAINLSASNVDDQAGAKIDISGGGDLYAYRFVSGTGGTKDILNSTTSYAVIPSYAAGYAPVSSSDYNNASLAVGQQVYLNGSNGLPAGVYTLLPARYALLPGAFLITPKSTPAPGTTSQRADGSSIVSGYMFNGLDKTQTATPLLSSFEVASQSAVKSRAQYDGFSANTFLSQSAAANNVAVPRLPKDAGQLVLAATQTMNIQGSVLSTTPKGGLGSEVDIASPSDILIGGPGTTAGAGTLVLDASGLSAFGADSLLIGGYRKSGTDGTHVTVTTNNLTVDNTGNALTGPDLVLVSNRTLNVASDAVITQSGSLSSPAETLLLGNSAVAGSGDGVLLRVTSDASAQVHRSGVDSSPLPTLAIGAGATISGNGVTLDSTAASLFDSSANFGGKNVSISSGQISLVLDGSQPTTGLVLSGEALANLQSSTQTLSLLSYSSIDIYEDGIGAIGAEADASGKYQVQSLALHANSIRGFDGGTVSINAQNVILDNSTGSSAQNSVAVPTVGGLIVNAGTIQLGGGTGVNTLNVAGYSDLDLLASGGVLLRSTASNAKDSSGNAIQGAASLVTARNLQITTPLVTGASGANQTLTAGGNLLINQLPGANAPTVAGGLGATLNLNAASVAVNSTVQLSSGVITIDAKNGDVNVGGTLDVKGTAKAFNNLTRYTSGGLIKLTSDTGSVNLDPGSVVDVSAPAGGGNAGSLAVSAAHGGFNYTGSTLHAQGGTSGKGGVFVADVGTIPSGSLQPLNTALNGAGFNQSISIRDRTDSNVSIDGTVKAGAYNLSLDQGSITVNGTIEASNVAATDSTGKAILVGGAINLVASGSVTLASGSVLNVSGQNFSNAGKGGSVSLEAGSEINGAINPNAVVDIQSGSTINLAVAANTGSSAAAGNFTGTLHIRAPQTPDGLDLQVNPINGTVLGASSITVEGYHLYNLDNPAGSVVDDIEDDVLANGTTFAGNSAAITSRLLANNGALAPVFNVEVGAEIINPSGDLALLSDWDLSTYRFGPNGTPGVLTMRAGGNLIFNGSLSDGFTTTDPTSLYSAPLMTQNTALPANLQSWTYHLAAGADFSAADFHQVVSNAEAYDPATGLAVPGTAAGSLQLGVFVGSNNGNPISTGGSGAQTVDALSGYYQVIRTGTGDIDIAVAGDVLLQNQFATIYTAGAQVADPTLGGRFSTPVLQLDGVDLYPAQYSLAGGNVNVSAQGNLAHVTQNNSGTIVMDSEKQLPNNWLYRRGYVSVTGADAGQFGTAANGDIASTSWWTDFSNFFEGIGTLGGGNVNLTAGHDVSNVDAVAATNARMTYQTATGSLKASDQTLVELGGGDVIVRAGNDINGGAYYVERGQGALSAGNSIVTNFTRSASLQTLTLPPSTTDTRTWLPTTLLLGKGSFDVSAQGDVLLGPVANPFLLPQGKGNTYWDKTYFSTYAPTDSVNTASLTGDVTLRESATLSSSSVATPLLQNWFMAVDLVNQQSLSYYQPWLRLTETSVDPFATVVALLPPALKATAFSGDINTVGNLTLSPSAIGTVDLVAGGSVNGLQPTGLSNILNGATNEAWAASTINLSDADPSAIPGINTPYAYQVVVGTSSAASKTVGGFIRVNGVSVPVELDLSFINNLFAESGSVEGQYGVLQTKLQLHANINGAPLHAGDANPVHIYAADGDISGVTLFSGKAAQVVAGQDLTDIALYIQNASASDISLVSAGRDIIAYDANSPLRVAAQSLGNAVTFGSNPLSGDIQISGQGTLEVLAGRNLNLGVGPNNADGTGVGITSIGNQRNPSLPYGGADIVALAGIGPAATLDASKLNFTTTDHTGFIDQFLNPATGGSEASRYLPNLGALLGLKDSTNAEIWTAFNQLPTEKQDNLALDIFYLVLRNSGRDRNSGAVSGDSNYESGFAAIQALFPSAVKWQGDISLTAREIKTEHGGNINLLAPGGRLDVGLNVAGAQAADQGILTEDGGNISIFTNGDVDVGTSRIFTLNGGNEIIWSSFGGVAAGASSKTVQSAPPTRVLIDPQSGSVKTDLAGLATGGGIGVLQSSIDAPPADVDLIAPHGTVNAGDAGIRASGNLNIAAVQVLNASNISVGGKSSGTPTVVTPNVGALSAASTTAGATSNAANEAARQARSQSNSQSTEMPSIITVEVIGYGGTDEGNLGSL